MTDPLYIVRLVLDRREVARVAARHRFPQEVDEGYLLHAGLSQLFATSSERAEVPLHNFAIDDTRAATAQQPDALFLLAYAGMDHSALTAAMGAARGTILRHCDTRRLPEFEPGQRLGFRTRVCPIVRTRQQGDRPLGVDRRGKPKHREMDAFIHASLAVGPDERINRETVYARWLACELARGGAADCDPADLRLAQFQREAMRRRGSPRMERPNALLEGTLTIRDPLAFRALLARGIGRHRAFGFGMLLLRPPSSR